MLWKSRRRSRRQRLLRRAALRVAVGVGGALAAWAWGLIKATL